MARARLQTGLSIQTFTTIFFDRPEIQRRVDTAGAFIMSRARKSIRRPKGKRRKASPRGSPPRRHVSTGAFGVHKILFGWDKVTRSVVVGSVAGGTRYGGHTVPELHERGGRVRQTMPAAAYEAMTAERFKRGKDTRKPAGLKRDSRGRFVKRDTCWRQPVPPWLASSRC